MEKKLFPRLVLTASLLLFALVVLWSFPTPYDKEQTAEKTEEMP